MAPVEVSINEMREGAARFAAKWAGETYERGESQSFWNDWFRVFGIDRRSVAKFEHYVERLSGGSGFIDLFWPGYLIVEQKSANKDLERAEGQAFDYLYGVSNKDMPKIIISSDFSRFVVRDLESDTSYEFPLEELPQKVELFAWIAGHKKRHFEDEDEVDVVAAELMGRLYDLLQASGYGGHELTTLLVRLLFVLFADDTGIWEHHQFSDYLLNHTADDGHDVGIHLGLLFQVLNTPEERRQTTLDESLARFPYINGSLFAEQISLPSFDAKMRARLVDASRFDWRAISPAVFGSMFQSVMDGEQRRALGAHYTREQNILKVIGPLFLDELVKRVAQANSVRALKTVHEEIGALRFLDPACGCGNFLIVTYRELRQLELSILSRIRDLSGPTYQLTTDVSQVRKVRIDHFYGIELEEFPAKIAEVAMYLTDHAMNNELLRDFGLAVAEFPIKQSAAIVRGNALRMDWNSVLPREDCSYVLGNPPFIGKAHRNEEQRSDMAHVFRGITSHGVLDYVTAWYMLAAKYTHSTQATTAFVSTNSIAQGEQVAVLWGALLATGARISFAHQTFDWSSEARGRAHVHVVIIGFTCGIPPKSKRLFSYEGPDAMPIETSVASISPYLVSGPSTVIKKLRSPLGLAAPRMSFGNMPNDGGHLILDDNEVRELLAETPDMEKYVRPLIGAREFLHGERRSCLWFEGAPPADVVRSPFVRKRIQAVRDYREASDRAATNVLARTPALFAEIRQPRGRYLVLPRHSSQTRNYIPMEFHDATDIVHDSAASIASASVYDFGMLSSDMFMTWVRTVAGRIKSDFRLSVELVYNPFPWIDATGIPRARVEDAATLVLAVRQEFASSTLAELYDPLSMPPALVRAHLALDRAVANLYSKSKSLETESGRRAVLINRYDAMANGAQLVTLL